MNVRTEADRLALNEKIKSELGVDLSKYRDPEVVERMSNMITFPLYALSWIIRPVLFALTAYLLGFFFLDLVHVQYLIYGLVGLVLAVASGLSAGLLYLTVRFRADVRSIVEYSLGILRGIVSDLDVLRTTTGPENRREVLQLLFLGIIHLITIPVTAEVIGNRIPVFGGLVVGLVRRVLSSLAGLFRWEQRQLEPAIMSGDNEGKVLPYYLATLNGMQRGMDAIVGTAIRVVQAPVILVFALFAGTTVLFIYLIH